MLVNIPAPWGIWVKGKLTGNPQFFNIKNM
jgi:hypothetical protein